MQARIITNPYKPILAYLSLILIALVPGSIVAQDFDSGGLLQDEFGELGLDGIGNGPSYVFDGNFTVDEGARTGHINVILEIGIGYHAYSQKKLDGQTPTKIRVTESPDFEVTGAFVPDKDPLPHESAIGPTEEFAGIVTWTAPIKLADGVDEKSLEINFVVSGQVCNATGCILFNPDEATVDAAFDKYMPVSSGPVGDTNFRADGGHAVISGELVKSVLKPGESTELKITATMDDGFHVYPFGVNKPDSQINVPTMIYFPKKSGWSTALPTASDEAEVHKSADDSVPDSAYHEKEITWTVKLTAPEDAAAGEHVLKGIMVYQICAKTCDQPQSLNFNVPVTIGDGAAQPAAISFVASTEYFGDVSTASDKYWHANDPEGLAAAVPAVTLPILSTYLVMAFFAGLILNAMPCVLPVIGLKVMSFVQQAGENRLQIFMLNLVFSLGLMTVFWILATLAAFFGMGWGDWLTKSMVGSIIVTSVVFAFALSMLGVWEIPIPGLASSGSGKEEGLSGAYVLGILTTILATPCTGPLLVPATTIIAGQPAWVAYSVFTALGLGMASPYLVIGLFPAMIKWLPRPGAWMNTFKQVTGFILMATVVFLMAAFGREPRSDYLVAMMTLLLAISVGCWWIGKTSMVAEVKDQLKAWSWGLGVIGTGAVLAFVFLVPSEYELDWQNYSHAKLGELRAANRIVVIDFTGPN